MIVSKELVLKLRLEDALTLLSKSCNEIDQLKAEIERKDRKITILYNEHIDLFAKWARGTTFQEWQAWQKKQQVIEKEAAALKDKGRKEGWLGDACLR